MVKWLLEIFPYVSTFLLAGCALIALLRNTAQGHAGFLLQLDSRWEALQSQRDKVVGLIDQATKEVFLQHATLSDCHRVEKLKERLKQDIIDLESTSITTYRELVVYLGFFETVGLMVRNKYIPLNEIIRLYDGPINDIDIVFTEHIAEWQKKVSVSDGLFENMLYLIKEIKHEKYLRKLSFFPRSIGRLRSFWGWRP
jgi:hypothetical protein